MDEQAKAPALKKPYSSPVIQVYGDIRTITKGKGAKGAFDNSVSGPKTKA